MEQNFDLHISKKIAKSGWDKIKRKSIKSSLALFLL